MKKETHIHIQAVIGVPSFSVQQLAVIGFIRWCQLSYFPASSVKSVGELWLRKLAKHVIQGEFSDSEGAKAV